MNKEFTKGDLKGIRLLLSRIKELAEETNGLSAKDNNRLALISSSAEDLIGVFKDPNEKGGEMNKEYDIYVNVINLDNEDRLHIVPTTDISADGIASLMESYLDDEASGDDVDTTCKWRVDYILDEKGDVVDTDK